VYILFPNKTKDLDTSDRSIRSTPLMLHVLLVVAPVVAPVVAAVTAESWHVAHQILGWKLAVDPVLVASLCPCEAVCSCCHHHKV
jgi:hypothetical protein